MRQMDIDPTFLPYLREALAIQPRPIREENPVERRARMAAARHKKAAPLPDDVTMEIQTIPVGGHKISARIYWPEAREPLPGVLYYHGGGWMYGSSEQSEATAVLVCRLTESVVVSPDYRLSPEHSFPAAFDDCFGTLLWTQENAQHLMIDPERLAVMGESSGGNLAAATAIAARDMGISGLRLQVLNYPALGTDFDTSAYLENADAPILSRDDLVYFWENYLAANIETNDPRAVPLCVEDCSGLAPAFITVAEYDPLRDDGQSYAQKLSQAGVPVDFHYAKRLPHGFMRAWGISEDVTALAEDMVARLCSALAVVDT